MFTRYSVIFPPSILSFCSWIQAPFTFCSVLFARLIPIPNVFEDATAGKGLN